MPPTHPLTPPENSPAPPPPDRLSPVVWLLGWVSLLTDTATEMIVPLLPHFFEAVLLTGKQGLGLIEGVAETVAALTRLPSGWLADRYGLRRPLMLLGYGLSGLIRPLMAFVTAPWQALAIRFFDRLGKGLRGAPRDALIAAVTPANLRGRAFGFHRGMDNLGAAIGPLIAFVLLWLLPAELAGWSAYRWVFLLTMIQGIIVVSLLAVRLPAESPPPRDAKLGTSDTDASFDTNSTALPQQPASTRFGWRVWAVLGATLVFQLGKPSDFMLLSRLDELQLPIASLPLVWCAWNILKSWLNLQGGRWADHWTAGGVLAVGWVVHIVIYASFGWITTAWQGLLLFAGYALYYGLAEPAEKLLLVQLVGPERRGTALGWHSLIQGVTALPTNLAFGLLWQRYSSQPYLPFGGAAIISLLGLVILLGVLRWQKTEIEMPE
ncbi:MAG: MFS transporter [Pirellulales bacterium]|nr:MFS transporter [Pirellulales bacterium]